MKWTLAHIEKLKADGKIRDYKIINKPPSSIPAVGGRKVTKHFQKRSKEKEFIAWNLLIWSQQKCTPLEEEYRFHPEGRKWRFDWCFPSLMIAIEYEGGIFQENGDHRSIKGMQRDIEKYNSAQALGWKVLRFTALNYKTLLTDLNNLSC